MIRIMTMIRKIPEVKKTRRNKFMESIGINLTVRLHVIPPNNVPTPINKLLYARNKHLFWFEMLS